MRKHLFGFSCLIFAVLLFSACNNTDYGDFYGGRPVDSAAIQSAANLLEEQTKAPKDAVITTADGTRLWFWTESGEVYHCTPDCSRLNSAKTILSGAVEDALAAGKSRTCSVCCKESEP